MNVRIGIFHTRLDAMRVTTLILIFTFLSACSLTPQQYTVPELIEKVVVQNKDTRAITHFKVMAAGEGRGLEEGYWFLNSGLDYKNPETLSVALTPEVVTQVSKQYQLSKVTDLIGKSVRVEGKIEGKLYCVKPCNIDETLYKRARLDISSLDKIEIIQ